MEIIQKYGVRVAGTPNNISSQVKVKLQQLIDKTVDELATPNLSVSHKLKLLEIALTTRRTKLAHTYNELEQKQKTFRVEYVPSHEEKDNS